MKKITLAEYNAIHKDYRGIWTTYRSDIDNWESGKYMGKRTMMVNDNGTALHVEGIHFEIVD